VTDEPATEHELAPAQAAALIENGAQLVDVRRPYEWEGGHLGGARHIEMNDLSAAADSIERDRPVVFYCRGGNRSSMAAEAFRQAGYDAYHVAGGIQAWAEEGLPLEPEGGEVRSPLPAT
jgi:rhodanese-related sulfurtransferase